MLIIPPKVELMKRPFGPKAREQHVELCGRVCYKSEDRIAEGTAAKFIASIIKHGHEAMLEHSRVMILIEGKNGASFNCQKLFHIQNTMRNKGLCDYLVSSAGIRGHYVSGNMRAWRALCHFAFDNGLDLPWQVKQLVHDNPAFFPEYAFPDSGHSEERFPWHCDSPERRRIHSWYSFRITCDRGVSHELVRHRPASFAQESTRYCNYSKGQFGGQITVIEPCFFAPDTPPYHHWKAGCEAAEQAYFELLNDGCSPQQARTVLPNSLKTEIIMTATAAEWLIFLGLRMDKAAHPQMREVATQIGQILVNYDPDVFQKAYLDIEKKNRGELGNGKA